MVLEVQLWGSEGRPSLISVESIALSWFLEKYVTSSVEVRVVYSNNIELSPAKTLPMMTDLATGRYFTSYRDILKHMISLDDSFDGKQTLLQEGLLEFVISDVNLLTEYEVYLNKHNYDEFTKKEFIKLLYWPLWNIVPSQRREEAITKTKNWVGYISENDGPSYDDTTVEPVNTKENEMMESMTQSKTFAIKNQMKKRQKQELKDIKYNLQFLGKLNAYHKKFIKLRSRVDLQDVNDPYNAMIDLLYYANIYVWSKLPNHEEIINHLLTDDQINSDEFSNILTTIKELNSNANHNKSIAIREPYFSEQCNIIMTLYNYTTGYI